MSHEIRRGPDPEVADLERITLVSPDGLEAAFVPGGGLVGTSLTLDGAELLARRGGLPAYLERGSTFGIPLLAPWANRLAEVHQRFGEVEWDVRPGGPGAHPDEFGQAIHGLLAGAREWVVEDASADATRARLVASLRFDDGLDRFAAFPFPHDLVVEIELSGLTLRVTTSLTAIADRAVPVAFGWHPWFAFPDTPREQWEIDVPFVRRATLSGRMIPTGEVLDAPLARGHLGDRAIDDVFLHVADGSSATVGGARHAVSVTYVRGYGVGVVFAPTDQDVVCVEPMTAPTDPFAGRWPLRAAAPGETVTAVFELMAHRLTR